MLRCSISLMRFSFTSWQTSCAQRWGLPASGRLHTDRLWSAGWQRGCRCRFRRTATLRRRSLGWRHRSSVELCGRVSAGERAGPPPAGGCCYVSLPEAAAESAETYQKGRARSARLTEHYDLVVFILWVRVCACSHPQSPWVQHFGVFGEMHLHVAVLAERHSQFLQGLVSTVRTEHFVHVAGHPETKRHSANVLMLNVSATTSSTVRPAWSQTDHSVTVSYNVFIGNNTALSLYFAFFCALLWRAPLL